MNKLETQINLETSVPPWKLNLDFGNITFHKGITSCSLQLFTRILMNVPKSRLFLDCRSWVDLQMKIKS